MKRDEGVTIRRVKGQLFADASGADYLRETMENELPVNGDYLIIKASPGVVKVIEDVLRSQLVPYGVRP